jgi:hypothetical protein
MRKIRKDLGLHDSFAVVKDPYFKYTISEPTNSEKRYSRDGSSSKIIYPIDKPIVSVSLADKAKQARKEKDKYKKYQEFLYWQKRACEARKFANILIIYNIITQIGPLMNPASETEYYLYSVLMFNTLCMSLLSFNTYSNPARLQNNTFIILLDM